MTCGACGLQDAVYREPVVDVMAHEIENVSDDAHKAVSEVLLERERRRRDWGAIGIGLASAFALIGLYGAGMWAVWVVVDALT